MAAARPDGSEQYDVVRFRKILLITLCIIQAVLSGAFMIAFEERGYYVLIVNPFFMAAGIFGAVGAYIENIICLKIHIMGSLGLSTVFMIYTAFSYYFTPYEKDDITLYIHLPLAVYIACTSLFSYRLIRSLRQWKTARIEGRLLPRDGYGSAIESGRGGNGGSGGGRSINADPSAPAKTPPAIVTRNTTPTAVSVSIGAVDPSAPPSTPSSAGCVVCLDAPSVCAVLPCGHKCLCESCASSLKGKGVTECPLCRGPFDSFVHIFG